MTARNSQIISGTFRANTARNNPVALTGEGFPANVPEMGTHLRQKSRTPFRATVRIGENRQVDRTSLYRHFAGDGTLLYVGISLSWPARTKAHAGGSRWFDQVAKVEIEWFDTREAAIESEREAIKHERPRFNIIHNRLASTHTQPVERVRPVRSSDPLLRAIAGPDVIVGPALNYRDELLSVIIAHGEAGSASHLTEVVLGEWAGEIPEWAHVAASVITIRRANQITLDEVGETRHEIIQNLKLHLRSVDSYETDIAFAVANAATFPSDEARQILDQVAVERGAGS